MASAVAKVSSFGQLLKQSKFSSFDTRIAQVYTTHGGDAHRGDWGFKRPLSIRRRGAFITVKNVDTPEHQTEWSSAEPQALWMKNWDELQITPQWSHHASAEEPRDHVQESDYLPNQRDPSTWRPPCVPNLDAMTREEFRKYLARIQAHRDQFHKETQAKKGVPGLSPYQLSNTYTTGWDDLYAQYLSKRRREDPRSRRIEHLPHRNGGLSYANYTPLQTFLMTKERKGRLVDEYVGKDRKKLFYVASFAGMAGIVQKHHAVLAQPMVWDDPQRTGQVMLRPQNAVLHRLPNVVGRVRQGLKATKMDMELKVSDRQSHVRSNPYPPGSRQYIAAEPLGSASSRRRRMDDAAARSRARLSPSTGVTLGILSNIIRKEDSS
ncbi:mitochondrial ribosomal protein subunit-domain-containing protein [Pisolithus orientalis]|uniref:mitochondrial ribosomal protein subunit-domain-containing protein n=1 Tax=Pisolithus orientalis TaxID=936130 RepID=UPI00222427D6|nr:mitochondrial ribosomal protein subunit-domain-containing protein [Pisolithus orientalis]KAI6028602.1 mitochondrial ribosomal protein subunit-domain-containing protein [Pisolithus orientalis]